MKNFKIIILFLIQFSFLIANEDYQTMKIYEQDKQGNSNIDFSLDQEEFFSDKEKLLEEIEKFAYVLSDASDELKDDKEVVLKAVNQYGHTLKYASQRLKADREIVLAAVQNDGMALEYVAENLKSEIDIVSIALEEDGNAFRYVPKSLQKNKSLVLKIFDDNTTSYVSLSVETLEYIDKSLLDDFEILQKVLSYDGRYLKKIPKDKQNNKILLNIAIKNTAHALMYLSKELRDDREFILKAMSYHPEALIYASQRLQKDKELRAIFFSFKNSDSYSLIADEVERKNFPKAWKTYGVDETIEALYGKDIVFEESSENNITTPSSNTVINRDLVPISIKSNIKLKSIAIIQEKEAYTGLMAYINTANNQPVDYKLTISFRNLTSVIVTVVLEGLDGTFYKYSRKLRMSSCGYQCNSPVVKFDTKKLRFRFDDHSKKMKIGFSSTVVNYKKSHSNQRFGSRKLLAPQYISKLTIKKKKNLLTEVYLSQYISSHFYFYLRSKYLSKGDVINIDIEDIYGKVETVKKTLGSKRLSKDDVINVHIEDVYAR